MKFGPRQILDFWNSVPVDRNPQAAVSRSARTWGALLALAVAVAGLAVLVRIAAPADARLRLYLIAASEAPGSIDSRLLHVPGLRAPPFDRFRTMTIVSLDEVALAVDAPFERRLPDGRRLRVVVRAVDPSGAYHVSATVDGPTSERDRPVMPASSVSPGSQIILALPDEPGALVILIEHGADLARGPMGRLRRLTPFAEG